MKKANDISEELKSMGSSLADLSRKMPYSVPEGFFEKFAGSLHNTISELDMADFIPTGSKRLPFSVPAGYFEQLTDNITAAVKANHLETSQPKATPFSTPAGYFETLPAQMLKAAKASDETITQTKVIPLSRRSFIRPLKWAVAAMLVAGIGLGSYSVFFTGQSSSSTDKILASVPSDEIHEYLQHTYRLDIDRIVGNNDVNNLQIENKDIVQYLDENGWDVAE